MLMLAVPIAASSSSWDSEHELYNNDLILSSDGSEADPYTINMLTGDQYSYTITTNLPSTYSVSGNLSSIGFSFETNVISGTAAEGKEKVCITATSSEGPSQTKTQWIQFNVYNVLTLGGTITQNAWAGSAYSSSITVTDVDPDASNEVTLTLNAEATTAGYTLNKVSETSYTITRSAEKNVAGSTELTVTATSNAGGIEQSKTMISTVTTYDQVGFTSTPANHDGQGTTVWLIEEDGQSWTYKPTATPSNATITASGLNSHMTYSNGTLTVQKVVFNSTQVTFTASSSSGGSTQTATQTLSIRGWDELEFLSSPSIENITHTVDGRTYTFNVKAANYNSIAWDVNGKTVDENSDTLTYDFSNAPAGTYTVRATAMDQIGRTATASTTVLLEANEGDPTPVDPDTNNNTDYEQWIKENQTAIIALIIGIILAIVGLIKIDEDYGIALIIVGVIIAAVALLFLSGTISIDSMQDWFSNLKGGSK